MPAWTTVTTPRNDSDFVLEVWRGHVHIASVAITSHVVGPPPVVDEITKLRSTLKDLDVLPLAALLRELGAVLYNRDVSQYRALTDVSDELLDTVTLRARQALAGRAVDNLLARRVPVTPDRQALRVSRRARKKAAV